MKPEDIRKRSPEERQREEEEAPGSNQSSEGMQGARLPEVPALYWPGQYSSGKNSRADKPRKTEFD